MLVMAKQTLNKKAFNRGQTLWEHLIISPFSPYSHSQTLYWMHGRIVIKGRKITKSSSFFLLEHAFAL